MKWKVDDLFKIEYHLWKFNQPMKRKFHKFLALHGDNEVLVSQHNRNYFRNFRITSRIWSITQFPFSQYVNVGSVGLSYLLRNYLNLENSGLWFIDMEIFDAFDFVNLSALRLHNWMKIGIKFKARFAEYYEFRNMKLTYRFFFWKNVILRLAFKSNTLLLMKCYTM